MSRRQIVGISLVRNEDIFVGAALRNVLGFCDRIMVADHDSQDRTWQIVSEISQRHPQVEVVRVRHPAESHSMIEHFAGSSTWIFAVDGDEIYDPAGLQILRDELLQGAYEDRWQIFGNVLNCTDIDYETMTAKGYLAPPCRSITKLFNFGAIDSWTGCSTERLHGGTIVFRRGYDGKTRLNLQQAVQWEKAELRCLHTCFMRRSSLEDDEPGIRMNIVEKNEEAHRRSLFKLLRLGRRAGRCRSYKEEKYMRGALEQKDVGVFFAPDMIPGRP